MNHLRPMSESEGCRRVIVVCLLPIPPTPKVQWVRPPRWMCALLGGTPARLICFVLLAVWQRPDVLGGFHIIPNGLLVGLLAPILGSRSLYFCGGGPREVLGGGILGNRVLDGISEPDPVAERRLIAAIDAVDRVVCMGLRSVEFYRARGVGARFEVIPGGIDSSRFTGGSGSAKRFDLIFVGRLVPVKRVDLYLDAIELLVKGSPDLKAVVVGSGSLESDLRETALRRGLTSNVEFVGHQQNVAKWLSESRVFVLTSDSEGLSLAMMEALTCGLPCVVSDVGELGEVVQDGVNGYLVRERSGEAFAGVLASLVRDPVHWSRLSSGALASAAPFELSRTKREWDRVLGGFSA